MISVTLYYNSITIERYQAGCKKPRTAKNLQNRESIWIYPFFWNLATSQLVTSQKPQTNELLQRKVTQTKKGNTKHNQTTTILFFTLLLTYGFLETIQIQTQEENIG